ncbi:rifamycin-inactivating phosphotransferase [Dactylosporangium sp. NPDC000521]|uniref:rifamycin-inactivating phosphotransferase n=1 Tax=Dactylosporangium sp. NPDC000521 TaxID=3363975 RepID=UPI00369D3ED3
MPEQYVLGLDEVDEARIGAVGGKGAHLGALTRIDGVRVPAGFCVTTAAFRRVMAALPPLDELSRPDADDPAAANARIRRAIEEAAVPDDVVAAITGALRRLGEQEAYAVRSSATAEDLPSASFAGQQDTYLNVTGPEAVLRHVRRCWASLFTDRAVSYRRRNGIEHGTVQMAVVVQRMVFPAAAGVLFTADPVTGDRRDVRVEAVHGLGEALVSGLVNADSFTVRDDAVVARTIGVKALAVDAAPAGGTLERAVDPAEQTRPALTDAQVVRLARLGRRIEAHFGRPQDIEWCLSGDDVHVVQSRPITTLFPVPETGDGGNHVYLSVGHQQMMTDAMKPLGLSFWQMTTPAPMAEAGGRLFVDVTARVASPAGRAALLEMIGRSDPLTGDALRTVLDRDGYIAPAPDGEAPAPLPAGATPEQLPTDPAVVTELIAQHQASIAELREAIRPLSGTALLDFIQADLQELRRLLFDRRSHHVFMSAMEAAWWLNERLEEWLGEKNASDPLTQSVPHNITSEMGLALLDVADVIRPHPELVAYLERADLSLEDMAKLPGGQEARDAIEAWLDTYGMRCAGEIDITRPRWSEQPSTLLPVILGNVRNFQPGAAARRFEEGRREALAKEQEILARLRGLPDGAAKAEETRQKIDRVRTFIGYREYPKYGMVSRYFIYKQALLGEADRLVRSGVLRDREDIFHLRFDELHEVVRTGHADASLIDRRKEEFRSYGTLTPPRVLTSDGEAITGAYRRDDLPPGALAGLPVSAGVVEGRARVVLDLAEADLEPGDILVTAYTDPSWTPLFVAVAGLVTEVGGQMTHGAVIAREYGLPAVVAVVGATTSIQDGQRIRVDGTDGYVEILS